MIDFRPENGTSLFCRTDYTFQPVANLDFHDAGWETIPFHLSLRPSEGRVVVNRRDRAGWRREIVLDHALDPAGGTVEVRFHPGAVSVWLDGQRLARFDRFPRPDAKGRMFLRRGFPSLGDIAHVTASGAVLPESLRHRKAGGRGGQAAVRRPAGALGLTDRLEAQGPVPAGAWLRLPGGGADLLVLTPVPGAEGEAGAVLPGRIWHGLAPDAAVVLDLTDAAGRGLGPGLRVTRAELRAALEALAIGDRLERDDLAALQAVEHARYAGVMPDLPPGVQAALWQAAARFGLAGWLAEGAPAGGQAPAAPVPARPPGQAAEDAICRDVAAALRADPAADPGTVLADVLARRPSPPAPEKLFLRLAEPFCARGAVPALMAAATAAGLDFSTRAWNEDRWSASVLVPFLVQAGRAAEVPKLLWWLAEPRPGWLITPAIAAGVAAAMDRPDLPEKLAEELTYAWIGIMAAQTDSYGGRSACAALRAVSVRLVAGAYRAPRWQRAPLRDFALRVHGLDPGFWAALAAAGQPDDPLLAEARDACATLVAAACGRPEDFTGIASALALFAWYRNADTARFRRILLGPSETPLALGQAPDLPALRTGSADPGAALLRHLMFPDDRLAAPDDAGLLRLAAEAVAPAWDGVAEPPYARLQRDLAARLPALLAEAAAGRAPDDAALAAVLADLAPLASARGRWLGLGLGLMLVEALAGGPPPCAAAAMVLADRLVLLAGATPPGERAARDAAPALAAV
ncbi:MAG: hypothetical protein Q8K20_13650, partial [Gemmobacter sp.]|nr:hypothetical protein [Gemmobacter sp.]